MSCPSTAARTRRPKDSFRSLDFYLTVDPTEATFFFPSYQPLHADLKEGCTWADSGPASLHGHQSPFLEAPPPGNMQKVASSLLAQPGSFPDHRHMQSCCVLLRENFFSFTWRRHQSRIIIHASIKSYILSLTVILKNMIQPYNRGNLAIGDKMDGLGGHYAKWNKSDRRRQILYDLTYMWNLKQTNKQTEPKNHEPLDTENTLVVAKDRGWTWGGVNWGRQSKSTSFQLK